MAWPAWKAAVKPFPAGSCRHGRTVGGQIVLNGQNLTGHNYHVFKEHGVAFLPAARWRRPVPV